MGNDGVVVATDLRLRVVDDFDEFLELRDAWDEAVLASLDPNPFLTSAWLSTWWRHFGHVATLHIVIVSDDEGIVALLPLATWRLGVWPGSCAVLRTVSHNAGDYGGAVVVRRASEVAALLASHLESEIVSKRRVAVLPRLPADTAILPFLTDRLRRLRALTAEETIIDSSLYTDFRGGFDFAAMAKSQRIAKKLRRLRTDHEVAFESMTGADFEAGLDRISPPLSGTVERAARDPAGALVEARARSIPRGRAHRARSMWLGTDHDLERGRSTDRGSALPRVQFMPLPTQDGLRSCVRSLLPRLSADTSLV